jgi:hypothetical protein
LACKRKSKFCPFLARNVFNDNNTTDSRATRTTKKQREEVKKGTRTGRQIDGEKVRSRDGEIKRQNV